MTAIACPYVKSPINVPPPDSGKRELSQPLPGEVYAAMLEFVSEFCRRINAVPRFGARVDASVVGDHEVRLFSEAVRLYPYLLPNQDVSVAVSSLVRDGRPIVLTGAARRGRPVQSGATNAALDLLRGEIAQITGRPCSTSEATDWLTGPHRVVAARLVRPLAQRAVADEKEARAELKRLIQARDDHAQQHRQRDDLQRQLAKERGRLDVRGGDTARVDRLRAQLKTMPRGARTLRTVGAEAARMQRNHTSRVALEASQLRKWRAALAALRSTKNEAPHAESRGTPKST